MSAPTANTDRTKGAVLFPSRQHIVSRSRFLPVVLAFVVLAPTTSDATESDPQFADPIEFHYCGNTLLFGTLARCSTSATATNGGAISGSATVGGLAHPLGPAHVLARAETGYVLSLALQHRAEHIDLEIRGRLIYAHARRAFVGGYAGVGLGASISSGGSGGCDGCFPNVTVVSAGGHQEIHDEPLDSLLRFSPPPEAGGFDPGTYRIEVTLFADVRQTGFGESSADYKAQIDELVLTPASALAA